MANYAPNVTPGDIRVRTHYIGIRTTLGGLPEVEVYEERAILTASGEVSLGTCGSVPVGQFDPADAFQMRNPSDDALTGETGNVAQAFALIYSWVRSKQLARDEAMAKGQ